jgi:uncharacterized protein (TIGR04255 family)
MVNAASYPPLPSYSHPPVTEVSFGIVFNPLTAMQSRHFGEFWVDLKEEYPRTEDASPLLDGIGAEAARLTLLEMPPLRRMMSYSADDQYVAQVQESRVYLNWRKVKPENAYPRYAAIYPKFEQLWGRFSSFADREKIGSPSISRYELAYFNHVELGSNVADSLEEHVKLFRFSPVEATFLSQPESVNATWRFAMPQQRGTATATLGNAKNQKGQDLLVLVLTCTGAPSEKYSTTEWFQAAHEWIVRSFTDLTTGTAHQKWGRET